MSEVTDKIRDLKHIPIFPLPLVLLPNEMLPLHIFEPRYRQMLEDIKPTGNLFGVTFFDAEEGFSSRPEVGTVGCIAEIRETQAVPDGKFNIITIGLIRYHLLEYVDLGMPYLTAEVGFFEDDPENLADITPLADEVFRLFERIAKAAFKLGGNRGRFPEVPKSEPEQLSFLVTAAFNLENELKYQLLEMTSTSDRLDKLRGILLQAVDQMEESAEIFKRAQTNGFSNKKLDI